MLWLQHTLLGTIATTVAIIAVAFIGVMMLTGRVNFRHGATVVMGCFILFGASSIVAGIQSGIGGSYAGPGDALATTEPAGSPLEVLPPPPSQPDPSADPYAGASVLRR